MSPVGPGSPGTALRERIRAGERLLGIILRMPGEPLIELAGLAGLDYAVIDCEHGPAEGLAGHLTAAAAAGIAALVRVSGESPAEIQRALDLGATGIVVPHIDTAERARAAVRAAHYPPGGDRGFAAYTRAARYGLTPAAEHLRRANEQTVVIVMIEDQAGAQDAGDIAATGGVDAVFAGPSDLAADLGHPGEPGHLLVLEATARIHAAARAHDRAIVTIVSGAAEAGAALAGGTTMILYNVQAAITALFTQLAHVRWAATIEGKADR